METITKMRYGINADHAKLALNQLCKTMKKRTRLYALNARFTQNNIELQQLSKAKNITLKGYNDRLYIMKIEHLLNLFVVYQHCSIL